MITVRFETEHSYEIEVFIQLYKFISDIRGCYTDLLPALPLTETLTNSTWVT